MKFTNVLNTIEKTVPSGITRSVYPGDKPDIFGKDIGKQYRKKKIMETPETVLNFGSKYFAITTESTVSKRATVTKNNNISKVQGQRGSGPVAFVFSCPGQQEKLANQVCAGTTGRNLDVLLEYCNKKRPDVFQSASRHTYTITNASERVHYPSLTGDTEPSNAEIALSENLSRLKGELSGKRYIICMGAKAYQAVSLANVNGKVVRSEHLSNMHLNRIYSSGSSTPEGRRKSRVEIVGDKILQQV